MSDDELAWETLSSETGYACPGFDVAHETVRLPDGTETEFDYLSEGASVVVLPFTPEEEVVIVEEWRQAVGRVNRGLPAGGVELEDPDQAAAARRELTEETGYVADGVEHLGTFEPANGVADAVFTYFVARGCRPDGEQRLDDNESIRVATTPFEELVAALRDDDLRDGRTALGVLYYHTFGDAG